MPTGTLSVAMWSGFLRWLRGFETIPSIPIIPPHSRVADALDSRLILDVDISLDVIG